MCDANYELPIIEKNWKIIFVLFLLKVAQMAEKKKAVRTLVGSPIFFDICIEKSASADNFVTEIIKCYETR